MTTTVRGEALAHFLGTDARVACIAEIGNAHQGSYQRALQLLRAAKAAGATAAKLQCYTPDELVALRGDGPAPAPWNDRTMRDLYTHLQTPHAWFAPLYAYAQSIGLPIFSSVFGLESLAVLESIGNPVYKIARLDNQSAELFAAVTATTRPVIISAAAGERVPGRVAAVLFCPPGYPQSSYRMDAVMWRGVSCGRGVRCGWSDPEYQGFSYHGTNPHDPAIAVALGARIIEAHFELTDAPNPVEHDVSLDQTQFATMVALVRHTETRIAL